MAQLAVGGRMVVPVGHHIGNQELMVVDKVGEGDIRSRPVCGVRYVPLCDAHEEPGVE